MGEYVLQKNGETSSAFGSEPYVSIMKLVDKELVLTIAADPFWYEFIHMFGDAWTTKDEIGVHWYKRAGMMRLIREALQTNYNFFT